MKNHVLTSLLLGTAVLALAGCKSRNQQAATGQVQKILVKTAPAHTAEIERIAEFTGTIEPDKQNNICPSTPVRIDEILVEVGDRVKKGQLLVKMDQTQYRQNAVQLANLETDFQRLKTVYEAGGASKQQVDQAETQIAVLREATANLKENIELRSPIDGVVTGRYYDAGDMFSLSPVDGVVGVLTVMQINPLKVIVHVSEQYFPEVKLGMPVDLLVDIYPDRTFNGKVSLIYPAIDASTRTFPVEVSIPNASGTLRPGMYARATLNLGKDTGVVVSDLAVQKQIGTNEKFVYVVKDSTAERRTVTTGRQIGNEVHILSGVDSGDQVVTAGITRLSDGAPVEVRND
ncbi:MAG: efflux RND transporter periplasmic adaptor subunit [Rikenellaceae bacterium]|nr:efflux RND transporter periplasmic adaptor subunit [Rikenellaceae bacterium]